MIPPDGKLWPGSGRDTTRALPGAAPPNGAATYIATAQYAQGNHANASVSVYLPPSASYTYDANGNLLSDGTRAFAYDDENHSSPSM